jgi:8-oxo-dGTP diphosphatase
MSKVDWDLLVRAHTEPNVKKIALAFVIRHYAFAFIARRHPSDFLAGCYELPEGLINEDETIIGASQRILAIHYGLELKEIETFLNAFTYTSGNGYLSKMFVFTVTVKDPFNVKLDRNDHGVWLQLSDFKNWPIITHFQESLLFFWLGESFSFPLAYTLVEQSKIQGFWRQKVRAVVYRGEEVLFLKRARRNKTLPLIYELPGKEIDFSAQLDSALVSCVTEQTGWAPDFISRFLGFYDYFSQASQSYVREFIYSVHAQDKPIRLSEHAYYVWKADLNDQALHLTPSAKLGFELFRQKFFLDREKAIQIPHPVYFKYDSSIDQKDEDRYLKAIENLEAKGIADIEALRGKPLNKKMVPQEFHQQLELDS